jgi:iron complex outermembrane receptor protein
MRETDAFTSLRWSGPIGRSVALMLTAFDAERGVPPEEHITAPRLWRYPYNYRAIAALSANAGSFATPFGYGTFELGAGYNTGRHKIESFADRTFQNVTAFELGDERTVSSRALFSHTLPANSRLKAAATFANVDYAETLAATAIADYRQRLWSAGAEIETPVTIRTTFATGLVYDRATTPRTGGRTPGDEMFDNIGWRAGITHDLDPTLRLHTSASQRSRFPSLRELYSGALDRFVPNPTLKPETLLGFETGLTLDRSLGRVPDATLQLNVFHHNLRDAIARITLPPPDGRFQRINRDRIRSSGLEFLGGLAFGENRERSVSLVADAMVQSITIADQTTTQARHAENNPGIRGMLELGIPLPRKARAFANARYTGRQYCLNSETGTEMALSSNTQSNFAVERTLVVRQRGAIRGMRVVLALDNAANVAIYDQCGLTQPGRTLRMMLSVK